MLQHNRWRKMRLNDAFWFQEGPGVRKWQFTNSGIKLLNVANITKRGELDLGKTDRHLSEEEIAQKYAHFLVDEGDLVIASSGISFAEDGLLRTRGAFVRKHHLPLCMNTSTIRFKAKENISDLGFLKFWLDSKEFRTQITRYVTGSAQQNFGPSHLNLIEIMLPPLDEQKRIAAVLDKADALSEKRQQAINKLDTLLPSILFDMFGDPITNSKGWPMTVLGNHLTFVTSGSRGWAKYYSPVGARFIRSLDVRMNYISDSDAVYVNPLLGKEAERAKVKPGDVLLTITGSRIGRIAPVPQGIGEAYVSQHVAILRLDDRFHPGFVSMFISEDRGGQHQIRKMQYGQTKPGLNLEQIRTFKIPQIPLSLQKEFVERSDKVRELRNKQYSSLSQLETLFKIVQQRAFNGELFSKKAETVNQLAEVVQHV